MKNHSPYTVHLHKDGVLHSFGPDEELPAWAAKLVDNPLVTGQKPAATGDAKASRGEPAPTPAASPDEGDVPPQAGAGSGRDVWAAYAEEHGVDVEDDWKRDQIIDACKKAGVQVE